MTLPDYTLRYSKKAKYLQVRISVSGLEVVVPTKGKISPTMIDAFLQQKKPWIVRHWQRRQISLEVHDNTALALPESILLRAMAETWNVQYLATDSSKIRCMTNQDKQIKLLGAITQQSHCIRLLKQWLKKMAALHLTQQLQSLAYEHRLSFNQLTVRHTVTRWGSCSSDQHISLCAKLLFLPPHLVKHVLLHELCHTKVMSHGVRFWKLLTKLDPDCDKNREELKRANEYVPLWAR